MYSWDDLEFTIADVALLRGPPAYLPVEPGAPALPDPVLLGLRDAHDTVTVTQYLYSTRY